MTTTSAARIGARTLCVVLVGLLLSTVGLATSVERAEAVGGYRVAWTGTGLNVRSGPSTGHGLVARYPDGTALDLRCWVRGQLVNGRNNVWYQLNRPHAGAYVTASYVTTPSDPLPGLPACGAAPAPRPAPAPAPRPAPAPSGYPSVMATTGGYYDCTADLPGCASRGSVAAGTAVRMNCWIDDRPATGAYRSPRWFHVSTTTGIRAFVHSSRVARQTGVPHCGTHRGISAARWAAMQVGEVTPSAAERGANRTMVRWSGWCYVLAWDAHALSHGARPYSGLGTAKATFAAYQRNGRVATNLDPNAIQIGSIVFWTWGSAGHAAIYVGQGQVVSTRGYERDAHPVARVPMSTFGQPAGWVSPNSI